MKKPFEPLIFQLLRYFKEPDIVHILDGYVCKVLDSLVSNRFEQFVAILEQYGRFGMI